MPARKRVGRPKKRAADKCAPLTVTLYQEDFDRLATLKERYGLRTESECVRWALETMAAVDDLEFVKAARKR